MTRVIGLTGSIAVGKSTVTHYLLTHGYQVVDADKISHDALNPGNSCYVWLFKRRWNNESASIG